MHYVAVVSFYLVALFVQEGRASAQQTTYFLAVARFMNETLVAQTVSNLLILSFDIQLVQ